MAIISISLTDEILSDVVDYCKKVGISNKSDFFRTAVSSFLNSNYRVILKPTQIYTTAITIVVSENHTHAIHDLLHKTTVRSQFHMCLEKNRCMEVFGISCNGSVLTSVLDSLEKLPKVEKVVVCFEK